MAEMKKLVLVDAPKTRGTLCKFMREAHEAQKDGRGFDLQYGRFMVECFKLLLQFFKTEAELRVSEELADIREKLKDKGII